jgi:hypothetical protein
MVSVAGLTASLIEAFCWLVNQPGLRESTVALARSVARLLSIGLLAI